MLESIESRLQDVESVFKIASNCSDDSDELVHWVRYLCVLISATLQSAIQAILREHVRSTGSPTSVQRFVSNQLDRTRNPFLSEIIGIHNRFDTQWGQRIKGFVTGEKAAAITSVVNNRNAVSHGGTCTATIGDLSNWFKDIEEVISFCHDLVLGEFQEDNEERYRSVGDHIREHL